MKYFLSYNRSKTTSFIIGGVHLSQALSSLANICEYEVIIIDPREYFANKKRFPNDLIINEWPDVALKITILIFQTI